MSRTQQRVLYSTLRNAGIKNSDKVPKLASWIACTSNTRPTQLVGMQPISSPPLSSSFLSLMARPLFWGNDVCGDVGVGGCQTCRRHWGDKRVFKAGEMPVGFIIESSCCTWWTPCFNPPSSHTRLACKLHAFASTLDIDSRFEYRPLGSSSSVIYTHTHPR
ncbi:uncharacterized protein UTRI_01799 [Ustilago trichophora]|uniref:Uncharacterized protein n=1 Tax=Ustilago trichophora TaxID=86804 RepID=A0A5C3E0T3_9BASI|nr:uncharacterized protein UTRI_01799 [Ustilago trichophora]